MNRSQFSTTLKRKFNFKAESSGNRQILNINNTENNKSINSIERI